MITILLLFVAMVVAAGLIEEALDWLLGLGELSTRYSRRGRGRR